jgi:uncharacterized protein (DUF433 family)
MKYIHSDPDIMAGELVIVGTRIPIDQVVLMLQDGQSVEEIHATYPWVPKKTLQGAIREVLSEALNVLAAKHHA